MSMCASEKEREKKREMHCFFIFVRKKKELIKTATQMSKAQI